MEDKTSILIRNSIECENNMEEAIQLMNVFLEETEAVLSEEDKEARQEKRENLKKKWNRLKELLESLKKLQFSSEIRKRKLKSDLEKLLKRVEKDMASSGFYKKALQSSSSIDSRDNSTDAALLQLTKTKSNLTQEEPLGSNLTVLSSQNFSKINEKQKEEDIQHLLDACSLLEKFAVFHSQITEDQKDNLSLEERHLQKGILSSEEKQLNQVRDALENGIGRARSIYESVIEEDEREDRRTKTLWNSIEDHYGQQAPKNEGNEVQNKKNKKPFFFGLCWS